MWKSLLRMRRQEVQTKQLAPVLSEEKEKERNGMHLILL
jgi:hypothetical protein